ncbi:hypothetical protein COV15_00145 [Candidatus Woesearchaeota archaeon CG10_big_fil_rev_8_21_14_0_10_34_12]|nr:MAG: hypothetical protein COV15_00145 [Candidatus Woesearchaeota archaeon CG10_big_fil_rev_8_21_14_0_10_34_12]
MITKRETLKKNIAIPQRFGDVMESILQTYFLIMPSIGVNGAYHEAKWGVVSSIDLRDEKEVSQMLSTINYLIVNQGRIPKA